MSNKATLIMLHAQAQFQPMKACAGPSGTRELFTRSEHLALAVAWNDSRFRIKAPAIIGRWTERLFGLRTPQPLADPLLDALRRFAFGILVNREDASALTELVDAGFIPAKIDTLRVLLGQPVPARRAN